MSDSERRSGKERRRPAASRVLVTGGAGFIGSHLVDELLVAGYAVRVYDDFSTGRRANLAHVAGGAAVAGGTALATGPGGGGGSSAAGAAGAAAAAPAEAVEVIEGDVRDLEGVRAAMQGCDTVVHLAAVASVADSYERLDEVNCINVGGTVKVLRAARELGVGRVVFASSCAVYGDAATLPIDEATAPRPLSPYAVGKLAGEGYCRTLAAEASDGSDGAGDGDADGDTGECDDAATDSDAGSVGEGDVADDAGTVDDARGGGDEKSDNSETPDETPPGLDTLSFRFFNVYGPRQDASSPYSGVIAMFMSLAAQRRSCVVHGDGKQTRDFVFVHDVARALVAAVAHEGRFDGRVVNLGSGSETSVNEIAAAVRHVSTAEMPQRAGEARSGDIRRSCADVTAAAELLDWRPTVAFEQGMKLTWQWFAG